MCFGDDGKAQKAAIRAQAADNAANRALMERQIAAEAPFREEELKRARFGTSFLPTVEKTVRNPTVSPGFDIVLNKGLDALRSKYAATGSPSSGPAQVAGGEFATGVANNELNRFNENLFRAAGFQGAAAPSQAPQYINAIQSGTNNLNDLMFARAFNRGGSGSGATLFGAGVGAASQLPWGSLFAAPAVAGTGAAAAAGTAGLGVSSSVAAGGASVAEQLAAMGFLFV